MRVPVSTALAAVLLAGSALVTVGAASASASGTPMCVSRSEFQHVTLGMTRTRVHNIFGIDGIQTFRNAHNGHVDTQRQYQSCVRGAETIYFRDSRVTGKSAS